jgi:hypothetical protein
VSEHRSNGYYPKTVRHWVTGITDEGYEFTVSIDYVRAYTSKRKALAMAEKFSASLESYEATVCEPQDEVFV